MARKRHKPEEIVTKPRQVEVLVGQGMARVDAIREVRITEQTYYRWRKQYGGMGTGLAPEKWRAPTEKPGGVLCHKGNDRRRSFVARLCGWR